MSSSAEKSSSDELSLVGGRLEGKAEPAVEGVLQEEMCKIYEKSTK